MYPADASDILWQVSVQCYSKWLQMSCSYPTARQFRLVDATVMRLAICRWK